MPGALDQSPVAGQIAVELLGQGQARVWATVDVAEHFVSAPDHEAVEIGALDLQHEVARDGVVEGLKPAERHAGARFPAARTNRLGRRVAGFGWISHGAPSPLAGEGRDP